MTILPQSFSVRLVRLVLFIGGIAIAAPVLTGQQPASLPQPVSVPPHPLSPELQTRPRYHIQPGDVIELNFPLETDFNQAITVAPDGYVSLKGIGDFYANGKSLTELHQALLTAYSSILHNPIINIDLKDFQKPFFLVNGQVAHPGKFDLREDLTVTEALAIAGGVTDSAKSSQVLLFRRVQGGSMVEVRKLDMHKMYKKGDLTEDVPLQPGDLVYVPQTALSKIQKFLPTSSMDMYATPGLP
jgi:polysaccharide biosynthesis/export protein